MPAILLSLAPILLRYAPDLIGMIAGGGAQDTAQSVIKHVQDIFGTTDASAVQAQIDADPAKADELTEKLNAETEQLKANIENDKDARATTVALAKAGSPIAYGPIVISVLIILAFVAVLFAFFTLKLNFNDVTGQVVLILIGTLGSAFTQVVNYWLGSSAGSQRMGEAVRQIATNIPIKTPVPVSVAKRK